MGKYYVHETHTHRQTQQILIIRMVSNNIQVGLSSGSYMMNTFKKATYNLHYAYALKGQTNEKLNFDG